MVNGAFALDAALRNGYEYDMAKSLLSRAMSILGRRPRTMTEAAKEQRRKAAKSRWEKHRADQKKKRNSK